MGLAQKPKAQMTWRGRGRLHDKSDTERKTMNQAPILLEGATRYIIGVDVGTGSARAGLFDLEGRMLSVAKRDITL